MRAPVFIALLAGGCSLAIDHDVHPRSCQRSAQCAVLNDIDDLPLDAVTQWYCPPGAATARVCTLGPVDEDGDRESPASLAGGTDCDDADPRRGSRQHESADGVDNDCNGVIDDGVWRVGATATPPAAPAVLGAATMAPATLATAVRSDGALALAATTSGAQGLFGASDGASLSLNGLTYRSVTTQFTASMDTPERCPVGSPAVAATCGFGDLAVADAGATQWFSASVNLEGCARGNLRLGVFGESDRAVVLDARTGAQGSNVATGVDVTAGRCTGASRMPALDGAARPALSSMPGSPSPRALTTWLAADAASPACGTPKNLEALGVWLATGPDEQNRPRSWVTATNGGRPAVLDATSGSGRAAMLTLGTTGYLVAHGRPSGTVALHLVPAFAAAEPASGVAVDVTRAAFEVPAAATMAIDVVVIAAGTQRGALRDLGVAWKEGCGATGTLRFARVRFDAANPAASTASTPVVLATGTADRPGIAYVDGGIRVVGARVGARAVTADDDGGWVVAWVDGAGGAASVRAQRVSELDAALLAETPVTLASGVGASAGVALGPGGAMGAGALRYVVHDGAGARWVGGELVVRAGR